MDSATAAAAELMVSDGGTRAEPGAHHFPARADRVPATPLRAVQNSMPQVTPLTMPSPDELAEVHRLAGHVARGALEVLAGARQPQQLASVLVPALYRSLLARADLSKRARATDQERFAKLHQGVKTHSVHSCPVASGVYELAVVVTERIRCRALAMRIEKQGGNWKVTALLIG